MGACSCGLTRWTDYCGEGGGLLWALSCGLRCFWCRTWERCCLFEARRRSTMQCRVQRVCCDTASDDAASFVRCDLWDEGLWDRLLVIGLGTRCSWYWWADCLIRLCEVLWSSLLLWTSIVSDSLLPALHCGYRDRELCVCHCWAITQIWLLVNEWWVAFDAINLCIIHFIVWVLVLAQGHSTVVSHSAFKEGLTLSFVVELCEPWMWLDLPQIQALCWICAK